MHFKNVVNYIADARREHNLTLSYVPLYNYGGNQLKVIYNNARSFKKHYIDVKENYNMLAANVICIAESRLGPGELSH